MSKVIENKNKLLNIQRLLFIVLLIEIILIGIITRGSGDTGAYVSFVYQYSIGNIPYLDFWYQQGIAYPMILSIPVKLFGSGLLVHRIIFIFLSMSCLYVFYRMLIDLEINIVENIKFKYLEYLIGFSLLWVEYFLNFH